MSHRILSVTSRPSQNFSRRQLCVSSLLEASHAKYSTNNNPMFYDQNDAVTRPDILRLDGSHLLTVYKHQVGGHADSMKKARGSSLLLKPVGP